MKCVDEFNAIIILLALKWYSGGCTFFCQLNVKQSSLDAHAENIFCFSVTLMGEDGDILLDFSKNIISDQTLALLFKLVSAHVLLYQMLATYMCVYF